MIFIRHVMEASWICGSTLSLLAYAVLCIHLQVAGAGEQELVMLRNAYEKWLSEVSFSSTYTRTLGRAGSFEDAINGKWKHRFPEESITGVMNKAANKVRHSTDYAAPSSITSETSGSISVTKSDFEEVSNGSVMISHTPVLDPRKAGGVALITPNQAVESQKEVARYSAGPKSSRAMSPLSINGNEVGSYLTIPENATDTSILVEMPQEQVYTVLLEYALNDVKTSILVSFSESYGLPVVYEIDQNQVTKDGTTWRSLSKVIEFAYPESLAIPKVIRSAFTSFDPRFPGDDVAVFEWSSPDIGKKSPQEDDFLISIPPTTKVRGLADVSSVMANGKIDIDKVETTRVTTFFMEKPFLHEGDDKVSSSSGFRYLLYVNAALVFLVVSLYFFSRVVRR